jgi:hypothetical protein
MSLGTTIYECILPEKFRILTCTIPEGREQILVVGVKGGKEWVGTYIKRLTVPEVIEMARTSVDEIGEPLLDSNSIKNIFQPEKAGSILS